MTPRELLRWLAIYALLTAFSSGRWALAPVAWVTPLVGLYVVHRMPAGRGFAALWLATFLPSSVAWHGTIPFPLPVYAAFMLFNGLAATLPYLLDRLLAPRLGARRFWTSLIFPSAVTAVEFLLMGEGPLGSFGAQAYTQAPLAPLVQLASVTGLWGITFVVAWTAAVAHWAIRRHAAGLPYRQPAAVFGALLVAVLCVGTARLLAAPAAERTVRVASFTAAHVDMAALQRLRASDREAFRERTRAQHAAYLQRTKEAAAADARIVLWPELAGLGEADDVAALVAAGRALAGQHNLYLAMPLFVFDASDPLAPAVNKIVVADPAGQIVLEHVKYGGNLLEGTLPGSRVLQTVETPFGTLSAVICWDTDYPAVLRQASALRVDILLSPAYVWPEVARIHAEMAPFRSIENGMTLLRQSDGGFSLVSDPYGRVVARQDHLSEPGGMMVVDAPIQPVATVYAWLGDMVGQVSVLTVLLTVLVAIGRRLMRPARTVVQGASLCVAGSWRLREAPCAADDHGVHTNRHGKQPNGSARKDVGQEIHRAR